MEYFLLGLESMRGRAPGLRTVGVSVALLAIACGGGDEFTAGNSGGASGSAGSAGAGGTAGSGTGGTATGGAGGTGGTATGGTGGTATGGTGGTGGTATGGAGGGGAGGTTTGGTGGTATGGTGGSMTGGTGGTATGGTGGITTGGTGGTGGVPCTDLDGDGITTCQGDCDDNDANAAPGKAEICGDAVDNDCVNGVDDICQGLGTYVSGATGNDNNPGTRAAPVATINQGISNAVAIGGGVDVYIAAAPYSENVTVVEGVSLFGGYRCDPNLCDWQRDPFMYDSAILAQRPEGTVVPPTVTRATAIDGLRLMGQDGQSAGRGRVCLTIDEGTPTVTNNRIFGPTCTGGGWPAGRTAGVVVLSPSNDPRGPLIEGNQISGGTASSSTSSGILIENDIYPSPGPAYALIRGNTIRGGGGSSGNGITAYSTGVGTRVEGNDIWAGSAGAGTAWAVVAGAEITLDHNRVNFNNTTSTCAGGLARWCGGIYSESSSAILTNNVVYGTPTARSAAFYLTEAERPSGAVHVSSNLLHGGGVSPGPGSASLSAGAVFSIGTCTSCGFNGRNGELRNNIIAGGFGATQFAIYEDPSIGRSQHPLALQNNDLSILPGSISSGLYRYFDGALQTIWTTPAEVDQLAQLVQGLNVGSNLSVACTLDSTFHLSVTSQCIDKGTATDAPAADFEGEARPQGNAHDIGPDEAN